jgi:hypothetical protein
MIDAQTGRRRHAELPGGFDTAVPGQDAVLVVDQHRTGEAEAPDTVDDLADLFALVNAGVARPGPQLVEGKGFENAGGHRKGLLVGSYHLSRA